MRKLQKRFSVKVDGKTHKSFNSYQDAVEYYEQLRFTYNGFGESVVLVQNF